MFAIYYLKKKSCYNIVFPKNPILLKSIYIEKRPEEHTSKYSVSEGNGLHEIFPFIFLNFPKFCTEYLLQFLKFFKEK